MAARVQEDLGVTRAAEAREAEVHEAGAEAPEVAEGAVRTAEADAARIWDAGRGARPSGRGGPRFCCKEIAQP